ncbi:oligodendrocyte transcription factor 2 [Marmota marmota marmota]|uniref:oligodendrocyte transcription factor 2 n=1 Tax=Marmota marmota marmota TaxID=9994 RepID=UPI002092B790|nr:oligodendrocyte transcription factor 2 [Marmota marmota marmota]
MLPQRGIWIPPVPVSYTERFHCFDSPHTHRSILSAQSPLRTLGERTLQKLRLFPGAMDSDASLVSSRPSSPEPDDLFLPARSKGSSGSGFTGGTVSSSTPSDCPPELSAELRGAMGAAGAHPGDKLGGSGFKSSSSSTSSSTSSAATSSTKKDKKQMTEPELQQLRLKINSRERKRMHDLNICSIRPPHGLLKSPSAATAAPLGGGGGGSGGSGGFQHWGGMPCPCSMCQVPPPHHHVSAMGAGSLPRLTSDAK